MKKLEELLETLKKEKKDENFNKGQGFNFPKEISLKEASYKRGLDVICGCSTHLNSHNHSDISVMDGISSPESMVDMSAMRGFGGHGITDHGSMGGVLRAGKAGKEWKTGRYLKTNALFNYKEANLKKHTKSYTLCDENFAPLSESEIDNKVKNIKKCLVTHNTQDPKLFKIVKDDEFEKFGDFKVVSGCELYCSWEKDKDKKYNHITVYATGQTGHRALVLLTSIGSIASRRYTGGRGFFRPRVFIEDIALAIEEAAGELVVTTGCPISITSEALRNGQTDEAEEFFKFFVERLPKGRFFAELHLCDIGLDFNKNYPRAEDKFYSEVYGIPVSRFKHKTIQAAAEYSKKFFDELRLYVLGESLKEVSFGKNVKLTDRVDSSELYLNATNEEVRKEYEDLITTGKRHPLKAAGITEVSSDIFSKDTLYKLPDILKRCHFDAEALIEVGAEALSSTSEDEEEENCKSTTIKPKKKSGRSKKISLLDEESLVILDNAKRILNKLDSYESINDAPATFLSGAVLARFVLFSISQIGMEEKLQFVNAPEFIAGIFANPNIKKVCSEYDYETLRDLANKRLFYLEEILNGTINEEKCHDIARAIVSLLCVDLAYLPDELKPTAGDEFSKENEWIQHPDGNPMEKINKELIRLARKWDVPLLAATDSHMTSPDLLHVQDALMKRGKRFAWHMPRAYAIPRSDILGYIEDLGIDYTTEIDYVESPGNCAHVMIEKGVVELKDIVESFGAGSLLLDEVTPVGSFKWNTVVPSIRYMNHPYYEEALELLESGKLRELLPSKDSGEEFTFSDETINISTALIYVSVNKAKEQNLIPDTPEYNRARLSNLYLMQEVPHEQLADFFLVLQYVIDKWRKAGISVGPGRGSSGGMLVAMACGITFGDPLVKNFIEARWMNRGRKMKGAHADIDIDVSDRQKGGLILAALSKESFEDSIKLRPLTPLEKILHAETFFSSAQVRHELIGTTVDGKPLYKEVTFKQKSLAEGFKDNVAAPKAKSKKNTSDESSDEDIDADSLQAVEMDDSDGNIVFGCPIIRVGTYGSLKSKAAVKDSIRIADTTPFEDLPSFAIPPLAWKREHEDKIKFLTEEQINRLYEEEYFGHLSMTERLTKRRIKLAEYITKEMTMGQGLARLYQSETDYFLGSVYGITPDYWDSGASPPQGSVAAAKYFDSNPKIKNLVLDMLNIRKNMGVHAGGFCFGREVFERVSVRADKFGFISQNEMKDFETLGILKFDVLGLETLNQISQTFKMAIDELPHSKMSWLPEDIYKRVKSGESTDFIWRHIPLSTKEAIVAMCENRDMTFQIDTPVFGRELSQLKPEQIIALVKEHGDLDDVKNDYLVDILSAFLALFRPGPMKLNSHIEYIHRLLGKEYKVIHPWLEPIVKNTLGVIAFQEQVMAAYQKAVGCSEEETDEVRRAMGKKDIAALEKIDAEGRFKRGLVNQGVPDNIASEIWDMIVPFAEYGFNLSHSWHYALISAVTLFLKSHFTQYFFRVVMATSKQEDAARFLRGISADLRTACVMRSKAMMWEYIDDKYFPGLERIEGLNKKFIDRIIETKERLLADGYNSNNITAEVWFTYFGDITLSMAEKLSKSGSLRVLGSPEDIAEGYEKAITSYIKPKDALEKAVKKNNNKTSTVNTPVDDTPNPQPEPSVDLLDDLLFDVRENAKKDIDDRPVSKSGVQVRKREYKLGVKQVEVKEALLKHGIHFSKIKMGENAGEDSQYLTVESALSRVETNKTRGSGVRHLVLSLAKRERDFAIKEGRGAIVYITLEELEKGKRDTGQPIPVGGVYRTVGIPKNVQMVKKNKSEDIEPRVEFISEGYSIRAKFSLKMPQEQIDEITEMLKFEKMKTPFIIDIYCGEFSAEGRNIKYYKIEKVSKVS